ncbi:MAG TPA: DNA-processing protein DprA [bacterium]|nr:DNA-processing protein DprA [bacterium]
MSGKASEQGDAMISLDHAVRIALSASEDLGPKGMRAMFEKWGGPSALVHAAQRGDPGIPLALRPFLAGAEERGRTIAQQCEQLGIDILVRGSPDWPESLECLDDVPEILFVRGKLSVVQRSAVGIVGSRECSAAGEELAARMAARLAEEGWATVSGMARGIDAAAHRGSLDGGGETIAVLGCGIDVRYPEENLDLHQRIPQNGLLVSEFAPGMPPISGNFPRRNRILSALSQAIVLVECRVRSGALITCRHALDQGREVFIVPGWPTSPLSAGPLQFLREGARAIRNAEDLLEDLRGFGTPSIPAGEAVAEPALDERAARDARARLELLGPASRFPAAAQ